MLFKVVLDKEIRLFNCPETPSMELIHAYIRKVFPQVKRYTVYYLDEDNDQIVLESDLDLRVLMEGENKKPKIFVNQCEEPAFEETVKIELEEKQEEKREVKEKKVEVEVEVKKEGQGSDNAVIHKVKCDGCGIEPIIDTRFKCSVCPNFDLCPSCEPKGHDHPLIKLRLNEHLPLSCKLDFCKSQAEAIAQKMKESAIHEKEKFVFQSETERQQIIISYLGNILGEDDFKRYKDFSKECKSETYEDVIEEYLAWGEEGQGKLEKLLGWIKAHLAKLREEYL